MRVLLITIAVATVVVALPNVKEWEMDLEELKFHTKQDIIDFITEGDKNKVKQVKLTSFSFNDCGGANAIVNINSVSVTPDPLTFPGPLNVATTFKINADLNAPLTGDLYFAKKVLGKYIKLPCIDHFGSCTYSGLCQLLEKVQCPAAILKIGIDCRCPIKSDSYIFPKTEFDVDVSIIPAGDYEIRANVTTMAAGVTKVAACLQIEVSFT